MLHIVEIQVPNRKKFGGVFQSEFSLPSKMGKINGICVNVVPNACTRFKKENGMEKTLQTGTVSVSINNIDVISSSVKAACLAKMPTNSLNKNMVCFDLRTVKSGSLLRIIYEEVLFTPFVKADDPNLNDYFQPNEVPTNGYTVKIYINYVSKI